MARPPRLQFPNAFYHVFSRGNRKGLIYQDDFDYKEFEELLLDSAERSNVPLYCWCPLPNHFHLLVETPHANIAAFMQKLLNRYARYYNRRHKFVGHVFQGRFRAVICDRESYFLELVRYIHLNPYRVQKANFVPEGGWPWSSHRFYMNGQEPGWAKPYIQTVLRRFSDDLDEARQRYSQFLADGLKTGTWQDFYQMKKGRFLGGDRFIEESKQKMNQSVRAEWRPRSIDLDKILNHLCQIFQVSPEALMSDRRGQKVCRAREAYTFIARRYGRHPVTKIAAILKKDASAITHMFRRAQDRGESPQIKTVLKINSEAP